MTDLGTGQCEVSDKRVIDTALRLEKEWLVGRWARRVRSASPPGPGATTVTRHEGVDLITNRDTNAQ